jgi:YHS domain-containing protein
MTMCNGRNTGYVLLAALLSVGVYLGSCGWAGEAAADSEQKTEVSAARQEACKTALAEFNALIGDWRGVGMPKRASRQGAWQETAEWVWDFSQGPVSIRYEVKNGKLLETAALTYDPDAKLYRMRADFTDKTSREYTGKLDGAKLVMESAPDDDGEVHRITVTQLNEKRTLVLHEKRLAAQSFFTRIAEVGYTRAGTSLAVEGAGETECIVTGGKGTMAVTYKGQTYYVCCTGCRQAFDDDPEGILAEAKQREEEKRKKSRGGTNSGEQSES